MHFDSLLKTMRACLYMVFPYVELATFLLTTFQVFLSLVELILRRNCDFSWTFAQLEIVNDLISDYVSDLDDLKRDVLISLSQVVRLEFASSSYVWLDTVSLAFPLHLTKKLRIVKRFHKSHRGRGIYFLSRYWFACFRGHELIFHIGGSLSVCCSFHSSLDLHL